MIATHRGQALCQAISDNHIDADGMNELLHLRIHRGTRRREEVGILQAQFLAHQREDGLIEHLVLKMHGQRCTLALREIVDIVPLAHVKRMLEEFTLHGTRILDFLQHAHVHLLPETGNGRHTRRVGLLHRLLHLLRIGIHNQTGALCQSQDLPPLLKDVSEGQEVQYTVVLIHRHTLAVGLEGRMILAAGKDHALGVACRTTCIEHIGDIIHRSLGLQFLHLRLSGQIVAQFQEVIKVHRVGVVAGDAHILVEDDDALQRLTHREHATRLVILLLLAHEKEAHLGVAHHELYLLLRRRGIERYRHRTDAPGTEVAEEVLHRVLREHTDVLLHLHSEVQQGIRHLPDFVGELVPRNRFPFLTAEVLIDKHLAVAVVLCLVVNQARQMTVCLHIHLLLYIIWVQKYTN